MTPEQRSFALFLIAAIVVAMWVTVRDIISTRKQRRAQFFLRRDRHSALKFLNGDMEQYGVQPFTDDRCEGVRVIKREWKP